MSLIVLSRLLLRGPNTKTTVRCAGNWTKTQRQNQMSLVSSRRSWCSISNNFFEWHLFTPPIADFGNTLHLSRCDLDSISRNLRGVPSPSGSRHLSTFDFRRRIDSSKFSTTHTPHRPRKDYWNLTNQDSFNFVEK